ncbi:MAG: type 4a pilus biogenesis protein PilO, partial [Acidimicrobiales bacterium]
VIVSLYNAASDAGIDLTSISDSQPEAGTPPSVKISLAVTGHFYLILQFLNDLAALPRIVVIDNVALAPGGGANGVPKVGASPTLSVTLSGRVFVTSAPSTTGAGAPTTSPGTSNTIPGTGTTVPTTSTTVRAPTTTTTGTTGRPQ